MNLGKILLRLIPFVGGYLQKKDASEARGEGEPYAGFFSNLESAFSSAEAKYLGTQLTGAEREANAFTAEQSQLAWERSQRSADIAWQREYEASNTQYQRKVADLQAAGLNPMLAVSSGGSAIPSASVASASPGSSVSPGVGNLGDLLNFFSRLPMLKAQVENTEADTAVKRAEANKVSSEAAGQDIINKFNAETFELRKRGLELSNSLTTAQERSVYRGIDKMDADIALLKAEASEISSKIALNKSQELLNKVSAKQIVELLPYEKEYKSASSEASRQAAVLSAANASYQNGLIDGGYIDFMVSKAEGEAGIAISKAELDAIKTALRTGKIPEGMDIGLDSDSPALKWLLQPVSILLDNFNPLSNIFK